MLHTSYRLLKDKGACADGYRVFAKAMLAKGYRGDDTLIPLAEALESNDFNDTLWAFQAVPQEENAERDRIARLFACDCAEHIAHLWKAPQGVTWKPSDTIAVARRYALGMATDTELAAARAAAWAAAWDAAWAAARVAAWDAAWAAAWAAARVAAWDAAWAAERNWQREQLKGYLVREEALL